jgi:hypothetical protein
MKGSFYVMNDFADLFGNSGIDPDAAAVISGVIITYLAIIGVMLIFGLADYIMRGIAILNMSKKQGISYGWLGFIPVAKNYQLGAIAGEIEFGNKKISNPGLWNVLTPIIAGAVFMVVYFGIIISAVVSVSTSQSGEPDANFFLNLFAWIIVFVILISVAYLFVYLIRYLILHKVFSHYNKGQKPVFFLILSLFVPLAEAILLLICSNKPLVEAQTDNSGFVSNGGFSAVNTAKTSETPETNPAVFYVPPTLEIEENTTVVENENTGAADNAENTSD